MTKKAPRRTAQRILESTLELFNRFGEPNVSTTRIAAELGISPGNLYYHYPAKDALINRLQQDCEAELQQALGRADVAGDLEGAAELVRALMALVWRYRFMYRDLNDLLSKSRHFEARLQTMLRTQEAALRVLLRRLAASGQLVLGEEEAGMLARNMVVLLSFWLNYEYASDPREALEPAHAPLTLARGAAHILQLLAPYVPAERGDWQQQPGAAVALDAAALSH
ncbi:TetR/AcrR family transcriptional regulator [Xenophilus arseniciresistens]|uniref:TetR/AcrR family transcriptional regulator n=1 Tax=Xenophilus arseniciresistens TaxID=1283306 RepID=A0AAE3T019_9BURK|nr:TetR/AcrR family transcriptional regulator [Xenophilus arseniciresistens]MDA7417767.1 TetR/AcrR family transcriptional regulator [Xenophilus arseniciresistens]